MNTRHFVVTPVIRVYGTGDKKSGFRIVDGPHFSKNAAKDSARVLEKKFGTCVIHSESNRVFEDEETGKKRTIFPEPPGNWVSV